MVKLYTRNGDKGETKDYAGNVLPKDDWLIEIGGQIDSLQSAIDMAILLAPESKKILEEVQKKLWQVAGEISNCGGECLLWPVSLEDLDALEKAVDSLGEPPSGFVRFNTKKSIWFNECRVRCRELERGLVKFLREGKLRSEIFSYINRLSSLFFMLSYKSSKN